MSAQRPSRRQFLTMTGIGGALVASGILGCGGSTQAAVAATPPTIAAPAAPTTQTIQITAEEWEYTPSVVTLRRGVPAVLELKSLDRKHGFTAPGLGLRTDIVPGETARISFTPDKAGTFPFHCDVFCGEGHEDMAGKIEVI